MILAVVFFMVALTGCSSMKSWYTLRNECREGVQASCEEFQERNDVTGAVGAGLAGYNQQRLTEAEINALNNANQPRSVTCTPTGFNGAVTCTE